MNDTVTTTTNDAAAANLTNLTELTQMRPWTAEEMRDALLFPVLTYLNLDSNRVVRTSRLCHPPSTPRCNLLSVSFLSFLHRRTLHHIA